MVVETLRKLRFRGMDRYSGDHICLTSEKTQRWETLGNAQAPRHQPRCRAAHEEQGPSTARGLVAIVGAQQAHALVESQVLLGHRCESRGETAKMDVLMAN